MATGDPKVEIVKESTTKASFDFWTKGKEQEAAAPGRRGPKETTKQAGDYFAQDAVQQNMKQSKAFWSQQEQQPVNPASACKDTTERAKGDFAQDAVQRNMQQSKSFWSQQDGQALPPAERPPGAANASNPPPTKPPPKPRPERSPKAKPPPAKVPDSGIQKDSVVTDAFGYFQSGGQAKQPGAPHRATTEAAHEYLRAAEVKHNWSTKTEFWKEEEAKKKGGEERKKSGEERRRKGRSRPILPSQGESSQEHATGIPDPCQDSAPTADSQDEKYEEEHEEEVEERPENDRPDGEEEGEREGRRRGREGGGAVDGPDGSEEADDDDEDNIPALEVLDAPPAPSGPPPLPPRSHSTRTEKKSRKAMQRLGMRPVPGVARVILRKSKTITFVITQPDVYKSPSSDTYVIFGEARIEDALQEAGKKAAQLFTPHPAAAPAGARLSEDDDLEDVDDSQLDPKDVELVMAQAGVSRSQAARALAHHRGDIVNAIMELTM